MTPLLAVFVTFIVTGALVLLILAAREYLGTPSVPAAPNRDDEVRRLHAELVHLQQRYSALRKAHTRTVQSLVRLMKRLKELEPTQDPPTERTHDEQP